VLLLQLMSPIVVIIGISDCLGSQYYSPAGLRARSAKYLIAGAAANLVMNLCLIPFWGAVGAVIASVLAELLITWLYMHNCGGYLNWGQVAEQGWKKLVAGMAMLAAVLLLGKWIVPDIPAVIVQVVAGIGVYIAVLALLKDPFVGQMGKFLPFRKKN
jgi:O-antigen/teichoic acid export membrane protein